MEILLVAASSWLEIGLWISAAKGLLGLGLVIFVHELGHFLVAKACGVKCERFYVGFDPPIRIGPIQLPRALFRKQWGETEYGIGIIPLGGYVKMLGQDDNPANAAKEAERTRMSSEDGSQDPQEQLEYAVNPRSYTAKSVPQRMAIISAGVIFNLIFAVIFAASAYRMGVGYIPCYVGELVPGDPAWQAGLAPGDKILQLGRDGRFDESLRFRKDLSPGIFKAGAGSDLELRVRHSGGEETWISVRPQQGALPTPTIGIRPASKLVIQDDEGLPLSGGLPGSAAARAMPPLKAGDRIKALEVDGTRYELADAWQLQQFLQQYAEQPVSLVLDRDQNGQTREVVSELPPQPIKRFGLIMEFGPITAIRADSPAAQAGLSKGDQLKSINGEPIRDPLRLEHQLRSLSGQEVTLGVAGKEETFVVVPDATAFATTPAQPGSPIACDSVGLAFHVSSTAADIEADSPAAKAGLRQGDQIEKVVFVVPDDTSDDLKELFSALLQPIALSKEEPSWPVVMATLQAFPRYDVELDFTRNGKLTTRRLTSEASDIMSSSRGLLLAQVDDVRTASSWSEAFRLGWQETSEGVGTVVHVLKRIANRNTIKNLGGPGVIVYSATQSASAGLPELLLFLTMLSANLAVVNILPIPVLDGGHLVFLLWEGIFRKPLDERVVMGLTFAGLSFILGLMLFLIGKDVLFFQRMFG